MFRRRRDRKGGSRMLEGSQQQEVKGESHYQDALSRICGGRTRDGHEHRAMAELRPEPTNTFDPNAVAVFVDGLQVGYLSAPMAAKIQKRIMNALHQSGSIRCRALIVGGWDRGPRDRGHFGVRLFFDPAKI